MEARDECLRTLVQKADISQIEVAKRQEYVATLTTIIGDDPQVFTPLSQILIQECQEREKEAESA